MHLNVCPRQLMRRSFFSEAGSTMRSFRHWDTCMNNKVCKIFAITGIVLGSLITIWITGCVLRCFKHGVSGIIEFACWPCTACRRRGKYREAKAQTISPMIFTPGAPNMVYTPMVHPEPAHYLTKDQYYSERTQDGSDDEKYYDMAAQKQNMSYKDNYPRRVHTPIVYDEDVDHREELIWSTQRASQTGIPSPYAPYGGAAWGQHQQHQAPYPSDSATSGRNDLHLHHH
ncbi:HFL319Cp [Eremothecium sinecaudum]|uniref:HFL319Cp n=1 Tax=Eremothecium sinecaudum TaxID=45286 RepID=A0A0X8HU68_9SACH|nr:HFL319Cp [Eremothecium sinecaudum]AMD21537.1 HFL319Cp [Eremothecium sinecaudum]